MNLKVRVALALALVVLLVSAVAADAGKEPSLTVTNWRYCVDDMSGIQDGSGPFMLTVTAYGVSMTDVPRSQLEFVMTGSPMATGDIVFLDRGDPFRIAWMSVPSDSVVGTYQASLHVYTHGRLSKDLVSPPTSRGFDILTDQIGCGDITPVSAP